METTLVFDIETVADVAGGRRLLGLPAELPDADVAEAMAARRRSERGHDFQPPHLQRVVAISVALYRADADTLRVWSLGEPDTGEADLLRRFFDGIDRFKPVLVSWNGSGFDLPVLQHRSLVHAVAAPSYWDTGQIDREAKFANYLQRYGFRHTDLMDVLASYSYRNAAPLHEIALLLGFPGKLGMDGAQVGAAHAAGRIAEIRAYCETDVLNTWLVYLRFLRLRGGLDAAGEAREHARVREFLAGSAAPHWGEFARAWPQAAGEAPASNGGQGADDLPPAP